ncbi:OmpA family protein [Sorangium cellulosum]|uniref:OmpA family protein n=1 Tax=Sorangium cellulosum TaxID=56 RepID=UPI0009B8B547|nr:OmpA family protein [Sorangium cellulosum]
MRTLRALCLLSIVGAGVGLASGAARAQEAVREGEFSVQRFEPAPGSRNYLSVEGARMEASLGITAGLMFDYAREPFVLESCVSTTDCSSPDARDHRELPVISDMLTWNLLASITPTSWLQAGLRFPVAYVSGQGVDAATGAAAAEGLKAFGAGDPTLEAKVRFFGGPRDPLVLGAAADVSFPLGHATSEGSYLGSSSPVTAGLRLIVDGSAGPLSFGLNLRGKLLPEAARIASTEVGPVEFGYGGALGYQITPVLRVLAEGYGATQFSAQGGTNSLEVDGALQIAPRDLGLVFTVGGGAGVVEGIGVPVARGIAGILFVHEPGDGDADGVGDAADQCPALPEDRDGIADADGCPEDDGDGDGIPDESDRCPAKAEVINGLDDKDGCPDEVSDRDKDRVPDAQDRCPDQAGRVLLPEHYGCPDKDEDGVPDRVDKCADAPEDTDGFEDEDGCPDPDNDRDGVLDQQDECIDQPEVKNGFKDEDGCPDELPDSDGDGIPDEKDRCPKQPENLNGVEDLDGCPDRGASLVQVGDDDIKILQRVEFALNNDKIQGAQSFAVLDAVVSALSLHPEIFKVEVAGHTDDAGPADMNRSLSQRRAEAVVAYLTSKGVDRARLVARGYGPDKPIDDNKTAKGRQKNRRVEFVIVHSVKKPQQASGEPGATAPSPAAPTMVPSVPPAAAPTAAPAAPPRAAPPRAAPPAAPLPLAPPPPKP